jgi:hypothetical protein
MRVVVDRPQPQQHTGADLGADTLVVGEGQAHHREASIRTLLGPRLRRLGRLGRHCAAEAPDLGQGQGVEIERGDQALERGADLFG